jgi:T-complex protein 1 subunit zeta
MAAVKTLNPKAEVAQAQAALSVNISAVRGLQEVLRTNLGPKGTMKMLVSGSGDIKLTKDRRASSRNANSTSNSLLNSKSSNGPG